MELHRSEVIARANHLHRLWVLHAKTGSVLRIDCCTKCRSSEDEKLQCTATVPAVEYDIAKTDDGDAVQVEEA